MNRTSTSQVPLLKILVGAALLLLYFGAAAMADAASLGLTPSTGVYATNGTFSVRVIVNTGGKSVNAAEGTLTFNPKELSVVSVNRSGSIFNLWVTEPTYSNSAGTISFSGGLPSGYTGSAGTIMNVTFRAAGAGTARVSFKNGSVLANDGRGTNILTAMNGGSYTIQAQTTTPQAEVIEYVAPANTPGTPQITSATHADQTGWHTAKDAELTWTLPAGVTAVRTLLDQNPTTVPTKVYEDPIKAISLTDLPEGVSYFHLQFQNKDGWGKVAHYRLAVDSVNPSRIDIAQATTDMANPEQSLLVTVEDATSPVTRFKIKLDNDEPFEYMRENATSSIPLPRLEPGYRSVIIEAFDAAGNSIIGTHSFTIEAFTKPVFTEYPTEVTENVIPVIKGQTRANAEVVVTLTRVGTEPQTYTVTANENGEFVFIPEGRFSTGVYELTARATDTFGAQSEVSDTIRIAVQQPGFLRVGSFIVSILSVLIPLIVLVLALVALLWYFMLSTRRFKRGVRVETAEALEILRREFTELQTTLGYHERILLESRKTKQLTKAEAAMIEAVGAALQSSQQKVEKEIKDITELPNIKR